jgi:NAD(P)-dependent dehydrogenase (short-subunit alcohol dehydrogenase family)
VCDIRSPEAVQRLTDAAFSDRPLDVLVNNAAGNFTVLAAKHLITDWGDESVGSFLHHD